MFFKPGNALQHSNNSSSEMKEERQGRVSIHWQTLPPASIFWPVSRSLAKSRVGSGLDKTFKG